ncbi:MAG: hypothetical protein R3321_13175, partial [Nitrososphaeraceae archaeon]|nr:hypothetical protein [Nitrososphaeraceae archaeon]
MGKENRKELIIKPLVHDSALKHFINKLEGINLLYVNPLSGDVKNFKTIYDSDRADIIICHTN